MGSEKGQIEEVIHILRSSSSFVDTEHELRYLCFHPRLLLTSQAFGVLDYCTWPQPPAGETNNSLSDQAIKTTTVCKYSLFTGVCVGELNDCQVP